MSALAGLRVLDLTRLLPGGYCTLLLADHGADVIKVEDTGAGDYARADPAAFASLNRGKRSIQLDLKSDGGRAAFLRLGADADVVIESFRPGVMDRLGVGCDVLREARPSLVYCAITGYGQDGPLAARAGHDLNYLARTGVLALSGEADGPPVQASAQIADLAGGALMAAFGIMAALRSGAGQFVDISMADGALSLLAMPCGACSRAVTCRGAASSCWAGGCSVTAPTRAPTGGCRWARWSRSSGPRSVAASGARIWWRTSSTRPGRDAHREVAAVLRRGRAPSGRRSTPSTTAAWSRCSSSTRWCATSRCVARGMVVDGLLATPVRLSETPADYAPRRPARARRAHGRGARPRPATTRAGRSRRCASPAVRVAK